MRAGERVLSVCLAMFMLHVALRRASDPGSMLGVHMALPCYGVAPARLYASEVTAFERQSAGKRTR